MHLNKAPKRRVVLLASALVIVGANFATTHSARAESPTAPRSSGKLNVAAVQMRSTKDLAKNLAETKRHIEACAKKGARIVVFPECSVTGYFDSDYMKGFDAGTLADAERQVAEVCRAQQVYAIVGMPWREGDKLFNSAVVFAPDGKVLERYHKNHLAEAWPTPGDHLSVFPIDGVPCTIIVCHDVRYPELVRLPALAGAQCVFFVSHESGLKEEHKIEPYRAQIQARAVENTVYVVQANAPANFDTSGSHGQSRIIAPDGNLVEEASMFGVEVVAGTLDMKRATGRMASGSLANGPLAPWWREGLKSVRLIGATADGLATPTPPGTSTSAPAPAR